MKARNRMLAVAAAVLAVQMTGCSSTIDTTKPVVIDVSVSDSDLESKAELTWTELGKLTTYAEMRTAVDQIFGNEVVDGIKYGPFYIDANGSQRTNNTLQMVLGNQYAAQLLAADETVDSANVDAAYTDLSDSDRTPALINAYFNLLPDSTSDCFSGGDTLSRAEAMALVTRAALPVSTLTTTDDFTSAVTGTDYDQYINYAAQQNDNAYINTSDKSLTPDNFKGAMSRAEFVYLVMHYVYGPEAVLVFDAGSAALKDCINAGDLSAELNIADADRCNGYTLSHSLKNTDKGVTEELYKTLAMAADKGIIQTETRWNEGITKAEAIGIVVNAFGAYYEENGYLINSGEKGSTQAFGKQALDLWNKQDKNDMNCTEEAFVADYIADMENGMTPEEFEESIQERYSIAYEELQEQAEQEALLNASIKELWDKLQDQLTCDETTFTDEYKSQLDVQGDAFTEDAFTDYILDQYGIPAETTTTNNNNGGGSADTGNSGSTGNSGDTYTPPAQTEPVQTNPVTPPVQEPVETTPVTPPEDTGGSSGDDYENTIDELLGSVDPDAPDYELG